jgi:DNA processing protein
MIFKELTENDVYWLWLSLKCSAGSNAGDLLVGKYGFNPKDIYLSDTDDYIINEVPGELAERLNEKDLDQTDELIDWCRQNDVGILTPDNPLYPMRLKTIRNFPLTLFCKGRYPAPDIESNVCLAAVGTRRMTEY